MHKLLLPFLLLTVFLANAQTAHTSLYKLTAGKAIAVKGEPSACDVAVTLTNTSKDTLYYLSWSCSWQGMYRSSHSGISVEPSECDKNVPTRLVLAPGTSNTVTLKFLIKDKTTVPATFKTGFNLILLPGDNSWWDVWNEERKEENIIWSDEITFGTK